MPATEVWRRARVAFDRIVELPADAQNAQRHALRDEDAELADAVDALIAHDSGGPIFGALFDSASIQSSAVEVETLAARWVGQKLGAFRLTELIGHGGSGLVFVAQREGAFEQRVAVKILYRVLESATRARFEIERQILARIEHPHIARLIDGGTTDDGAPFLVMEWVDGRPITEHCDAEALRVDERIALFRQVTAAVGYAHRNLIAHCDLKPSNILVSREGQVKLLDFGIATLLSSPHDAETTSSGRWMTPSFASPEQLAGRPLTTATDIFSLGVLFYELLSGKRPYVPATDLASMVDRPAPMEPSRALAASATRSATESVDLARRRSGSVRRLVRTIRGDLDAIVLRMLQEDPLDRYPTVRDLHLDLERHQQLLPIATRSDDALYRLRRFVRRRAWWLVTAVVVASASLAVTWTSLRHAESMRRERDAAETARLEAQSTAEALTSVYELMEPVKGDGFQDGVIEAVESSAASIRERFADQPDRLSDFLNAIGTVYIKLGRGERAAAVFRESHDVARRAEGIKSRRVARALERLGRQAIVAGDRKRARPLLRTALAIREAIDPDEDSLDLVTSLSELAHLADFDQEPERAEAMFRRAIAIQERESATRSTDYGVNLNGLGFVLGSLGRHDEAERALLASFEVLKTLDKAQSRDGAVLLANLGGVVERAGRRDDAVRYKREALELLIELQGEASFEVQMIRNNLAQTLRTTGRLREAEVLYRRAVPALEALIDSDHEGLATARDGFGLLLRELGSLDEALAQAEAAFEARRTREGREHPVVATSHNNVGLVLLDMGRLAEAENHLREARAIDLAHARAESISVAIHGTNLGAILRAQGRFADALEYLEGARDIYREKLGDAHPRLGQNLLHLGATLIEIGRLDEAEVHLRRALEINEAKYGMTHHRTGASQLGLAKFFLAAGEPAKAQKQAESASETFDASLPENHWRRYEAQCVYGAALTVLGDPKGPPLLASAHETLRGLLGERAPIVVDCERRGSRQIAEH